MKVDTAVRRPGNQTPHQVSVQGRCWQGWCRSTLNGATCNSHSRSTTRKWRTQTAGLHLIVVQVYQPELGCKDCNSERTQLMRKLVRSCPLPVHSFIAQRNAKPTTTTSDDHKVHQQCITVASSTTSGPACSWRRRTRAADDAEGLPIWFARWVVVSNYSLLLAAV
jgi:hypothetical protein